MLNVLHRIIKEVSTADSIESALTLMVQRTREAIHASAVAIYVLDNPKNEFVLVATDGLNESAVNKVRFPKKEGLIGWVGHREEPISLEDNQAHEHFLEDCAVGEDAFHGFLGVPLIHQRQLYGVLTVQQELAERFDEKEQALVITLCTQYSSVIAHADATGTLAAFINPEPFKPTPGEEARVKGIPCVSGVGIGQAVVVYPPADLDAVPDKPVSNVSEELALFHQALSGAQSEIYQLSQRMLKTLPEEESALFDVYLKILESPGLREEIETQIRDGLWAQAALRNVVKRHVIQFESMDDAYLRERAVDFKDLGRRVLAQLQRKQVEVIDYPEQTILVGDEVTPAALAQVPEGHLVAVVSARGSSNSHVAILARAMGIPTVMGARGLAFNELNGQKLVVDGYHGQIYIDPSFKLLVEYEALLKEEKELDASLEELRGEEACTTDGHKIDLFVNTGVIADAGMSFSVGAQGIGLYRTEVSFMVRDHFPVEDEQYVIYRQLLKAFAPRPVTMRTLDIGGDKPLPYFPVEEDNPYLGWRGIRLTLDHPDIFLVQARAMLKANAGLDNLKVMMPMISHVREVDDALALINQAFQELSDEGIEDLTMPKIGVMIEVPSAVYQARAIAKRVDFLSVGTNDLTQYLLAVDRNNSRVSGLFDALHPAVLMALTQVVEGAHQEGKEVGVCGEIAADPIAVLVLLAMGFDSLSMNSSSLPRVKWVIRNFSMANARKLLSEVLSLEHPKLIRLHLENALLEAGLGGLIRAGKS